MLIRSNVMMWSWIDLSIAKKKHLINEEKKKKTRKETFTEKIKWHLLEQNGNDDRTITQSSQTCRKLLSHKGHNEYLISI